MKILVDTDPGIDDAIALGIALSKKDVRIVGITTVQGMFKNIEQGREAGEADFMMMKKKESNELKYLGRKICCKKSFVRSFALFICSSNKSIS